MGKRLLCKSSEVDIVELDLASLVNVLRILVVEDVCVLDVYVMNHTFCSMSHDAVLATTYVDVAHVDVLEVGQKLLLYWGCLLLGSHVVVPISGLEGDGVARNIGHIDVVDEDILRCSTSLHATLESQSGVCALEGVVANHDVLHAARKFTADNKTAMGMVNSIVLDVDVLARASFHASFSCAALHADAVIASIHDIVDNEHVLATRDVDGIAILCIPRTFHGDAVDNHILASGRDEVEARAIQ